MIVRITLALLFVVAAAMAYPWQSTADRWLLGASVVVVVVVFARWRGLFVTTMIARRISMLRRRKHTGGSHHSSEFATAVLRVEAATAESDVPLQLIAGYIHRYGVDFDKVRVTSREVDSVRTTWVGLTLGAADNVSALYARSPRMPLQDTVEVAARRLADQLREAGWNVVVEDADSSPVPEQGKETWRGITDGQGYLAAYRIRVDDQLAETLAALWASESGESWAVLEFTGSRACPKLTAACAMRTEDRPGARAPLPGLVAERGRHRPALAALATESDRRLFATAMPVSTELLSQLRWPSGAALSRT